MMGMIRLLSFFFFFFFFVAVAVAVDQEQHQEPKQYVVASSSLRGDGGATDGAGVGLDQQEQQERERGLAQASSSSWSSSSGTTTTSGGGSTTTTSWTSARPHRCPTLKCANPCYDGICRSDERCLTKTTYFFPSGAGGRRCPGCPVFRKCARKYYPPPPPVPRPVPAPRPVPTISICPVPACQLPCGLCTQAESCKTKPGYFTGPNGQKCPGCPIFVGCEPIYVPPPTNNQKCGKVTCPSGLVCCNASCSICTKPNMACTQQACVDMEEQQQCGKVTCPVGQVCCNASCGICTEPNGACTQQVCYP